MKSIDWHQRLAFCLLLVLVFNLHDIATSELGNTPETMLIYHGSAMLGDYFLLRIAPCFIRGNLCDDLQRLSLASMVCNFIGWLAYLAYVPPVFYDLSIMAVTYAQFTRLLLVDGGDALSIWSSLVRRLYIGRPQAHT